MAHAAEPLPGPYPEPQPLPQAPGPDPAAMRTGAAAACDLLRVLGNPDRLMLMCRLFQAEATVTMLEQALEIRQPTLSQQLAVLRAAQLVQTRREGRQIWYRADSPTAQALMGVLYEAFCAGSVRAAAVACDPGAAGADAAGPVVARQVRVR